MAHTPFGWYAPEQRNRWLIATTFMQTGARRIPLSVFPKVCVRSAHLVIPSRTLIVFFGSQCGTGPFAHVNSTFTPTNQSTPFNLTRRDGSSPDVRGLVLDYDFKSIPPSYVKLYSRYCLHFIYLS